MKTMIKGPQLSDYARNGELKRRLLQAMQWAMREVRSLELSQEFTVASKGVEGPVTTADLRADTILRRELFDSALVPVFCWLSEEGVVAAQSDQEVKNDLYWCIDPIDGTRGFIDGSGEYSISLALIEAGRPILGAVAIPAEERIILGGEGQGIALYGLESQKPLEERHTLPLPRSLALRSNDSPLDWSAIRIAISRSELKMGIWSDYPELLLYPTGSIARKLALLAVGEVDMVVSLVGKNDWDIAGGTALLRGIENSEVITLAPLAKRIFDPADTGSFGVVAGRPELVEAFSDLYVKKGRQ